MKYKMQTWKLIVEGDYETEEEAIKDLADKYMQCSKCDAPNEHPIEHLTGNYNRTIDNIGKRVYLYVEMEIFNKLQMVHKYTLNIYPFKQSHWWEDTNGVFKFEDKEFKFKIIDE
jgi:hypothetical protein